MSREEGRDLGLDADAAIGRVDRARHPRRGLLDDLEPLPQLLRAASAIAGGTRSEKNCAPWLPPKTRRWNGASAVARRIGRVGGREHGRPDRIAGIHDLAPTNFSAPVTRSKAVAIAVDAARGTLVGPAHDGVLLVDDRRDLAPGRREQRRHGRIAAEADHGRRPDPLR